MTKEGISKQLGIVAWKRKEKSKEPFKEADHFSRADKVFLCVNVAGRC